MTTVSPRELGLIPLGSVATIHYGKSRPATQGPVPVVGSGGVYAGTATPLADEAAIVVGRKGSAGTVWFLERPCWPSDTTFYLQPDTKVVEPKFLAYLLRTQPLTGEHAKTTMPSLQKDELANLKIALPPLVDQRRIARILSTILSYLESVRNEASAQERVHLAVLNEHFSSEIIKRCPRQPLGAIVPERTYGLSLRGSSSGRVPLLRMTNVRGGQVHFRDLQYVDVADDLATKYGVIDGDLLFNRTNSPDLVGRVGIVRGAPSAVFASYLIRLRCDRGTILPDYLNAFLNWPPTQQDLRGMATRGVSQSNISASTLATLLVPVPPRSEQIALIGRLAAFEAARAAHGKVADRADSLFDAALGRLLPKSA